MAVLDADALTKLRQECAREFGGDPAVEIDYVKADANKAFQAIEDWFEKPAVKAALKADIDAATSPVVFTNAQAKKLVKFWLLNKFGRE